MKAWRLTLTRVLSFKLVFSMSIAQSKRAHEQKRLFGSTCLARSSTSIPVEAVRGNGDDIDILSRVEMTITSCVRSIFEFASTSRAWRRRLQTKQ